MRSSAVMQEVEAILAGPEYFACESLRARIKRRQCLTNQQTAKRRAQTVSWALGALQWCLDCKQGREIKRGATPAPAVERKISKYHGFEGKDFRRPKPAARVRPAAPATKVTVGKGLQPEVTPRDKCPLCGKKSYGKSPYCFTHLLKNVGVK